MLAFFVVVFSFIVTGYFGSIIGDWVAVVDIVLLAVASLIVVFGFLVFIRSVVKVLKKSK